MIVDVGVGSLGVAACVGRAVSDGVGAGVGAAVGTGWLYVGAAVASTVSVEAGATVATNVGIAVGTLSSDAGVSPIPEHPTKTATTTPTTSITKNRNNLLTNPLPTKIDTRPPHPYYPIRPTINI